MKTALRRVLPGLLAALALSTPARAGETKDLGKTPQAKTYQALLAAVAAEDFEAYKKCMTKASVEGIEKETKETGLDPGKAMSLLKEMSPTELQYVALEVEARKRLFWQPGKSGARPTAERSTSSRNRASGKSPVRAGPTRSREFVGAALAAARGRGRTERSPERDKRRVRPR